MPEATTHFMRHVQGTLIVLACMVVAFFAYVWAETQVDQASDQRFHTLVLADEMRHSSDALTDLSRMFVVTGNPEYIEAFNGVMDARDGLRPSQQSHATRAFAKLAASNHKAVERLPSVALLDQMRQAGLTDEEFALLVRSKAMSDNLARTEREAMRLRQLQGPAAPAEHARALGMLHDDAYLVVKSGVIEPIEQFETLVMERINRNVAQTRRTAGLLRGLCIALGLALVYMLYRTSRVLWIIMGGSVDEVHARITRIGKGDFSASAQPVQAAPGTVLARLIETQDKLRHISQEQAQAQADLRKSTERLQEAERIALLGNWEFEHRSRAMVWSEEAFRIYGLPAHSATLSFDAIVATLHPDDRRTVIDGFEQAVRQNKPFEMTHRVQLPDGRTKHVHARALTYYDKQGQPERSVGTMQDVTRSWLDRQALERANRDLRLLSDCNMALVHAEKESELLQEICRLSVERGGYRLAWVSYVVHDDAKSVQLVAQHGDHNGYLDRIRLTWGNEPSAQGPVGTCIRTGQPSVVQDIATDPRMATRRVLALECGFRSMLALPLICDAQVLGVLALYAGESDAFDTAEVDLLMELATDLAFGITTLRTRTAHAVAQERLEFLANFDPLTHLPNRLLLRDRFEHATQMAQEGQAQVVLLYIDLDHFKQINDSLGYSVGDQVLVQMVERLQRCLPTSTTISRLSGDEFVVLLAGSYDAAAIVALGNAVREALVEPVQVDTHTISLSCSIGIGMYPGDGADFETLLKHAHAALVSAKEAGRNTYRFFAHDMNAGMLEQIRLTAALSQALVREEFLLHYQPQLDLRSGRLVGMEALVRWQHPVDGLIPPGRFIALAERSGHIIALGEWVLNEACRQGAVWQAAMAQPPLVAVNLSALQFKRGNVLELVQHALARSGLRPQLLELELTESILLQDVQETIKTLQGLKALGVKLSIDDFGTGYSSLSYLKQLAVDKLKIDQSFVRDMLGDADGASIVRAIIQLGHNLQLNVIAEGVETQEQCIFLAQAGCDEVQGYLFSRPVPPDAADRLLAQGIALPEALGAG